MDKKKAEGLSREILENRLAACINIVKDVKSLYWWQNKIETANEALMVIKTATKKVEQLIKFVKENHDYEIPEVTSMVIAEGNPDYLDWLDKETAGEVPQS
jgi:periplasmic divalent cation tolerance protein